MKPKTHLKFITLVFLVGFSLKTFSISKTKTIMNTKTEHIGLLVIMKAKAGKAEAVKNFLLGGLPLVNDEAETVSWFAFQIDENTYGIYDTFAVESGRTAHLKGEVAKALLANASELLENFNAETDIKAINVVAANHKFGVQNKGLLVIMNAKKGMEENLEAFLNVGKTLVNEEPNTLSWYAIKINTSTYAIFDTFTTDAGRDAHLTGAVASALMQNAPVLLDGFDVSAIQKIDLIASK